MVNRLFTRVWTRAAIIACGLISGAFAVAPFVTVPWNGYSGAASFTFDDALEDQVQQLTPMLSEMPEVKVTFFLTNAGMDLLYKNAAGFANLAKMGNEIGNHTNSHQQLSSLDKQELKYEILDFASEIENIMEENGASVSITAHAPPFCAYNREVSKIVDERHFISRGGGWHGRHRWDIEPQWTFIDAKVWFSYPNYIENILASLDTAAYIGNFSNAKPWDNFAKGPTWIVLLHHGIGYDGGTSITPEDMRTAFEHALKNKMWVAPFSTVGAYQRAHFTLDTANAILDGEKYRVKWEMPHKFMPASIPLKITISESFRSKTFGIGAPLVLEQNGNIIYPDENGVYTIEFTEQSAIIRRANSAKLFRTTQQNDSTTGFSHRPYKAGSLVNSQTTYTLFDIKGHKIGHVAGFEVPLTMPKGVYLVQAKTPGYATITRKIVR